MLRVVVAFGELMAQVEEHSREVDFDWTRLFAGAAEAAGVWQILSFREVGEHRGDDCADWTGIYPAVGVPADLAIDGAGVETSSAAQAVKRLSQLRVGEKA